MDSAVSGMKPVAESVGDSFRETCRVRGCLVGYRRHRRHDDCRQKSRRVFLPFVSRGLRHGGSIASLALALAAAVRNMKAMPISNKDGPVIRFDDPSDQAEQHFHTNPARIARPMSAPPESSSPSSRWNPSILRAPKRTRSPRQRQRQTPATLAPAWRKKAPHRTSRTPPIPFRASWR